jgi:hypothetical protein
VVPKVLKRTYLHGMRLQERTWSCGAAAVRNALRAFGKRVSEADVRSAAESASGPVEKSCGCAHPGTCEHGVLAAIRHFGFTAVVHRWDTQSEAWEWLHETLQSGKVVILCVHDWEHWVLAFGSLGPTGVVVFDSSNFRYNIQEAGVHVWSRRHLMECWTNTVHTNEDKTKMYAISVGKK